MANDIFNRTTLTHGGSFSADQAVLTLHGDKGGGPDLAALNIIAQQMSIQYQQSINRIYSLGESKFYYVGGRTQGQISMQRVVGPKGVVEGFYAAYGDLCNATRSISFALKAGLCNTDPPVKVQGVTYTALNCIIQSLNLAVNSNDMLITDTVSMMFGSLEQKAS